MGHNLNKNERTGRYSFFSVREKAWHGLGQIVQQYPTSAEAIKLAGLDYEVIKQPLYTHPPMGASGMLDELQGDGIIRNKLLVPDHFATMRTDNNTVFGVVGKDYQVVQNTEAFAFFDAIVGEIGRASCRERV